MQVKQLVNIIKSDLLAVTALLSAIIIKEYLAAGIVALMLMTGRVLEKWAEGKAERELKSLISRAPRTVHRLNADDKLEEIAVDELKVGDKILVKSGEIVATDGVLLDLATLDESALTGESLPVTRSIGEMIASGIVNAGNPFYFITNSSAEESTYASIIKLVKQAQDSSAPSIRLAHRWSMRFLPFAFSVALLAWWLSGDIHRAVAVLVVATPCPLILAVPIAVVAGLSRAAKAGAVIKGGGILELLGRTEIVLLDKTGTLTHGGPSVSEISSMPGISDDEVLIYSASVDQFSPHLVGKAIVREAVKRKLPLKNVSKIREEPGHHIMGIIEKQEVYVGQLDVHRPNWLHFDYPLMVAIKRDGKLIGVIGLVDPVRVEAKEMVNNLRLSGIKTIAIVTGDNEKTANLVAKAVGISDVHAGVSASGKLDLVEDYLASKNGVVVLVGDGINDAPALARADVGVAMGAKGASAASEAADVVIVDDSIDRLTSAIRISQMARKKALQASLLGMGLSVLAMILAMLGKLTPSEGAILQEFIDVLAISWALTALRARL